MVSSVSSPCVRSRLALARGSRTDIQGHTQRKSGLLRVFAVSTATDLAVTILLTLTLSLLTFFPSLSSPFGSFLCSSAFASDYSTSSASLLSGRSEQTWSAWQNGIEYVLWGVEACEEAWQTAMVLVLVGCAVTVALRIYGTWVIWEANADLREGELRDAGEGWVDVDEMEEVEPGGGEQKTPLLLEEALGRSRSSSSSGRRFSFASSHGDRRSNTLPLPYALEGHKRSRSNTIAFGQTDRRRPQLVFVPVMFDAHGQPICQPSSPTFAVPHYASPPRSRTSTRSSTLSSSPFRSSPPRPSPPVVYTAEPAAMDSPPRSPTCQSTCTASADEWTKRRLRSKSEDGHLFTSPVVV